MYFKKRLIVAVVFLILFTGLYAAGLSQTNPISENSDKPVIQHSGENRDENLQNNTEPRRLLPGERIELLYIIIGFLLMIVGMISLTIFLFYLNLRDKALLYFGIFILLYGIRVLLNNHLTYLSILSYSKFWAFVPTVITYFIPIPFILTLKQFVGWGWLSTIKYFLILQSFYTVSGIAYDFILNSPGRALLPLNNILVITGVLLMWISIYKVPLKKTPEIKTLKRLYPFLAIVVINENLVNLKLVPWNFGNETLFLVFLIFIIGFIITKRLIHKYKILQEHIRQADKMIAMGTLVSGVAHEINNPNNFIMLNSEILSKAWKDIKPILDEQSRFKKFKLGGIPYREAGPSIGNFIDDINKGSVRIDNIIQNLKNYARPGHNKIEGSIRLNEVLQSAVNLLGNRIKNSTSEFSMELKNDIPGISGNYQKLEQLAVNLILNSCQALKSKDQSIHILTGISTNAREVYFTVTDQGEGIHPDNLDQVINPFFTTRREDGGMGLGLSICSEIVKDHGGRMEIESRSGTGTTVSVHFPYNGREKKK